MASGDVVLDADGNMMLDANGNMILSTGDNSCCYHQARLCPSPTGDLVDVWIRAADVPSLPFYFTIDAEPGDTYFIAADAKPLPCPGTIVPLTDITEAAPCLEDAETPCAVCDDRTPLYVDVSIADVVICDCWSSGFGRSVKHNFGSIDGTFRLRFAGSKYGAACVWELVRDDLVGMTQYSNPDCATGTSVSMPYTHFLYLLYFDGAKMAASVVVVQSESSTNAFSSLASNDLFCTTDPSISVIGCNPMPDIPRLCSGRTLTHYNRIDDYCGAMGSAGHHHGYAVSTML